MNKVVKYLLYTVLVVAVFCGVYFVANAIVNGSYNSSDIIKENDTVSQMRDNVANSQVVDNRKEQENNHTDANLDETRNNYIHKMQFDSDKYDTGNYSAYGVPYSVYDRSLDENGKHGNFGDLEGELLPILEEVYANKDKYFGGLDSNYTKRDDVDISTMGYISPSEVEDTYWGTYNSEDVGYIEFDTSCASSMFFFDNYYIGYLTEMGHGMDKVIVFMDYSKRAFLTDTNYVEDGAVLEGYFRVFLDNCNEAKINGYQCYFAVDCGPLYTDYNGIDHTFEEIVRGDKIEW